MTIISKLVTAFMSDCTDVLNSTISKYISNNIKQNDIQTYLTAKQFKKQNPDATDEIRYNALMHKIVNILRDSKCIDNYVTNADVYHTHLYKLLISDDARDLLYVDFMKGSYKNIAQKLNRMFNPKKEDDTFDDFQNLQSYAKPYSYDFPDMLKELNDTYYAYTKEIVSDNRSDIVESHAFTLLNNDIDVFNIYEDEPESKEEENDNNFTTLCVTSKPIDDTLPGYTKISMSDAIDMLDQYCFVLNNVHYTNIDSLKRDFMNGNFTLFRNHYNILQRNSHVYFNTCDYTRNDDFNELTEDKIYNGINGFPKSFEYCSKNAFGVFIFNGTVGNVTVTCMWVTTKPIKDIMTDSDYNVFNWISESDNITELINEIQIKGTLGTSYLH